MKPNHILILLATSLSLSGCNSNEADYESVAEAASDFYGDDGDYIDDYEYAEGSDPKCNNGWMDQNYKRLNLENYGCIADNIFQVETGDYENRKFGIITDAGKTLLPIEYDHFELQENENIIVFKYADDDDTEVLVGRYGVVNTKGEWVIPLEYEMLEVMAEPFENHFKAMKNDEDCGCSNVEGIIGPDGTIVVPIEFRFLGNFNNGLASAEHHKGELSGYIDTKGKWAIKPQFRYPGDFKNGFAQIRSGGAKIDDDGNIIETPERMGLINTKGEFIIPMQYAQISTMSEGLVSVKDPESGLVGYFNDQGQQVMPFRYDYGGDFNDGVAEVERGGKPFNLTRDGKETARTFETIYYCDTDQIERVNKAAFQGAFEVTCETDQVVNVMKTGSMVNHNLHGLYTYSGQELFPPKYRLDTFYELNNGQILSHIRDDNNDYKYGLINDQGEVLAEPIYDYMQDLWSLDEADGNGPVTLTVKNNGKSGAINSYGELVIPFQFEDMGDFSEGRAVVYRDEKFGFVNREGDLIVDFKYSLAYPFSEGKAQVWDENEVGYEIDRDGNVIGRLE